MEDTTKTSQGSVVDSNVPAGFELADPGPGFGVVFGPLYRNLAANKIGFRVAEHHLNPVGVCHGGAIATFADMLVTAVYVPSETLASHTPTITISVDYIASARLGNWVEGTAVLVKSTRTMLFVQGLITADGEIISRANVIYRYYTLTP